jgi:hypothetical protein
MTIKKPIGFKMTNEFDDEVFDIKLDNEANIVVVDANQYEMTIDLEELCELIAALTDFREAIISS